MTLTGTTRWLALLGMVLALSLPAVLIACGGDEPDAGGERAAPTATDAARPTATTAPLLTIGRGSAETDREALLALYDTIDGEAFRLRYTDAWLSNAPIDELPGVTTDGNGRVNALRISNSIGEIPPELGNLVNLEHLYLGNSQLSGEIPPELSNLPNLERLDLSDNELSGCVPQSLAEHRDRIDLPLCGE